MNQSTEDQSTRITITKVHSITKEAFGKATKVPILKECHFGKIKL